MNNSKLIKPLTSLRFLFALMVFLSHLDWVKNNKFEYLYSSYFKEGYLGVNFFFVLSGFILALNYKNKQIKINRFYISRIGRIYPVYIFALFLILPLEIWYAKVDFYGWLNKILLSIFCLQSFVPDKNYYFSFNWPAWSISTEMFFYAIFPFLIKNNNKYLKTFFVLLSILIIISLNFVEESTAHALFYINPLFRIVDFYIGICLYDLFRNKKFTLSKLRWSFIEVFSIIIFFVFFYFHSDINQGYRFSVYYWIPVSIIIYIFASSEGVISYLLSNKLLIVLGEISFSFYLVHHTVMRYMRYLNEKYDFFHDNTLLAASIFALSLLLSYAMYKLIEVPFNLAIRNFYNHKYESSSTLTQPNESGRQVL